MQHFNSVFKKVFWREGERGGRKGGRGGRERREGGREREGGKG